MKHFKEFKNGLEKYHPNMKDDYDFVVTFIRHANRMEMDGNTDEYFDEFEVDCPNHTEYHKYEKEYLKELFGDLM